MSHSSSNYLWKRNLDGAALTLTSECETSQELASFLEACRENTTVRTVAFRESFLPLRQLRQHLTRKEFLQMLQAICRLKSLVRMVIPPTMPGMLRGVTASYFLPDWPEYEKDEDSDDVSYDEELYSSNLQEWIANGAVTFCTLQDVYAISEAIEELCPKLHWLEIQDFYVKLFRTTPQKQRQQQAGNNNNHNIDKDDGEDERLLDPLFQSLATQSELTVLKLSSHPDFEHHTSTVDAPSQSFEIIFAPRSLNSLLTQQYNTLKHATLARLGLVDQHFQVVATNMHRLRALETLDLNENAQTHSGTMLILQALAVHVPTTYPLMLLSMKPIINLETISVRQRDNDPQQGDMDWTLVFPCNVSLQYLETRTINLRHDEDRGYHGSGSDDETDDSSNENQNQEGFLDFWLHLNRMNRCDWGKIALTESSLLPVLLERLGRYSVSAQWHCIQTFLPQMHLFQ